MMGIFHLLMVYMSILNKRIDNAGLGDAHVKSSIIAEGSIEVALFGKSYNRGVRLHKVFYKALNRLLLSRLDEVLPLADFIHPIKEMDLFSKVTQSNSKTVMNHSRLQHVCFPLSFHLSLVFTFLH